MKILQSLLILTIAFASIAFTTDKKNGYKIGDKVENFTLKNIDGKMISLNDYKNKKGVIVVFTCNHCPYSKMYEDRIIALDKKFKNIGYPVVAINPNDPSVSLGDDFDSMKDRAESKGFTFPYLFDKDQKIYPRFGATKTPHVFILNKNHDNNFILSYIGAVDDNARDANNVKDRYVEKAISDLLEGTAPMVTETKAIGCSIKTKK